MGDYIRALQQRFDTQHPEWLVALNKELRNHLERPERKLLLRVIDTAEALRDEQSLVSFTAGFKLAHGIAEELGPRYSFAKEEEDRACQRANTQDKSDAGDGSQIKD